MTTNEKLKAFAALVTEQQKSRWIRDGYTHDMDDSRPGCAWVARVRPGPNYTRVDVGGSGKYMVENATGQIFGVKAYGRSPRGHSYGTLDTMQDWDWSGYVGVRKAVAA